MPIFVSVEQLDAAYDERNRVVAALARSIEYLYSEHEEHHAWLGVHQDVPGEAWDPEWRNVVYIDLPTGQCSWHIHDRDLPMFDWLPRLNVPYDGHSTEEKYLRVEKFAKGRTSA